MTAIPNNHRKMFQCRGNAGFTYLMALILIAVMGIMLGAIGQTWQTVMKREREAELLFRGSQIKDAITAWRKQNVTQPLNELKYLLEDPYSLEKKRYLRKLYSDPLTGNDWEIIRDAKGITGVRSSSQEAPLKVDGFPDDLKNLAGKKKYSEWEFKFSTAAQSAGTGATAITNQPATTSSPTQKSAK